MKKPFGLCNAPSTFQQCIFGDQQCKSVLLYLDDIVVFSSTVEQHLERLKTVLGRLQHEGLKAKLNKCSFQKEVHYLGHVISGDGVSTDPGKIDVVANWPLLPQRCVLFFVSLAITADLWRVLQSWWPIYIGW